MMGKIFFTTSIDRKRGVFRLVLLRKVAMKTVDDGPDVAGGVVRVAILAWVQLTPYNFLGSSTP